LLALQSIFHSGYFVSSLTITLQQDFSFFDCHLPTDLYYSVTQLQKFLVHRVTKFECPLNFHL